MGEFEFLFTFYGLLLGLALANTTTGFADMWRSRNEINLGIIVPLIALVIVAAVTSNWYIAWSSRDVLVVNPAMLLTSLGVCLPLVFVGHAMFPKRPEEWANLDDYYLDHRRILPIILLLSPLSSMLYGLLLFGPIALIGDWPRSLLVTALLIALPLSRRRWVHALGYALLAVGYTLRIVLQYRLDLAG